MSYVVPWDSALLHVGGCGVKGVINFSEGFPLFFFYMAAAENKANSDSREENEY